MRRLLSALVCGALLIPNQALTLGLGEIEVNSALNQNLNAEIELLSAAEGESESLIVKLASRDEFARAGIDRPYMLGELRFENVVRDGVPYVKVTTPKPVREPFLNFLVEADWPQGHMIREYTILLDPPIFSSRPVAAPESRPTMMDDGGSGRPTAQEIPVSTEDDYRPGMTSGGSARFETIDRFEQGDTLDVSGVDESGDVMRGQDAMLPMSEDGYRIQKGDTAWSLAKRMRPDETVSVEKMMIALLRTNPEAFIQENVNGLKRGYVLRVPDQAEVDAINQSDALAMVRKQNALWREYQQALATGSPITGIEGGSGIGASSDGATGSRLAIVGIDGDASQGTDPTSMTAEELRGELARTSEMLETERLEKEGLQQKVDALQGQVDNMKGLVTVEDQELAEMQAAQDPLRMPSSGMTEPVDESLAEAEVASIPAEEMAEPEPLEATKPVEKTKPVAEPKPKPKAKPEPAPAPEPGLLESPMVLGGIAAFVLLLVAGIVTVIMKRRKAAGGAEESAEDAYDEMSAGAELDEDATKVAGEDGAAVSDGEDEPAHDATVVLSEVPDHEKTVITEAVTPEASEAPAASEPAPEEESDDVMAEADVYLAYGIYQQAQELLESAIEEHPEKLMYRVKLCETLFAAKDADAFEAAARGLHEAEGGAESTGWLKVAALGQELCPGNELFENVNVEGVQASVTPAAAPSEMDIDLDGGEESATDVDFSLDDPFAEPDALPDFDDSGAVEESEELAEPEEELEFDLDETGAESAEEAGEDFSLDIDSSDLDIDAEDTDDEEASVDDDFVDESLDFGLDEVEAEDGEDSTEEVGDELDLDAGDMDLDISTDTDEPVAEEPAADLDIDMDFDTDDATSGNEDDDAIDISMDLEEADVDLTDMDFGTDEDTSDSGDTDDDAIDISMDLEDADLDMSDMDFGVDEEEEGSDDSDAIDISMELDDSDLDMDFGTDESEPASDDETAVEEDKTALDSDDDDFDLSSLDDVDEISTKLDLARAYMDMGDGDGARSILDEVVADGNDEQKQEAENLLKELGG